MVLYVSCTILTNVDVSVYRSTTEAHHLTSVLEQYTDTLVRIVQNTYTLLAQYISVLLPRQRGLMMV